MAGGVHLPGGSGHLLLLLEHKVGHMHMVWTRELSAEIDHHFSLFCRHYGIFKAKGIFEPPAQFPFGSTYNWEVRC